MIFRTGSVLIVGRCDENVLFTIYDYLKVILHNEYKSICQKTSGKGDNEEFSFKLKDKKKKMRKKNIVIEMDPNASI